MRGSAKKEMNTNKKKKKSKQKVKMCGHCCQKLFRADSVGTSLSLNRLQPSFVMEVDF